VVATWKVMLEQYPRKGPKVRTSGPWLFVGHLDRWCWCTFNLVRVIWVLLQQS